MVRRGGGQAYFARRVRAALEQPAANETMLAQQTRLHNNTILIASHHHIAGPPDSNVNIVDNGANTLLPHRKSDALPLSATKPGASPVARWLTI